MGEEKDVVREKENKDGVGEMDAAAEVAVEVVKEAMETELVTLGEMVMEEEESKSEPEEESELESEAKGNGLGREDKEEADLMEEEALDMEEDEDEEDEVEEEEGVVEGKEEEGSGRDVGSWMVWVKVYGGLSPKSLVAVTVISYSPGFNLQKKKKH